MLISGQTPKPMLVAYITFAVFVLAIPYLIWAVYRMLYNVLIANRWHGATESLSKSKELMRGNWWRSTTILTIVFIVMYLIAICGQLLSGVTVYVVSRDPVKVGLGVPEDKCLLSAFFPCHGWGSGASWDLFPILSFVKRAAI